MQLAAKGELRALNYVARAAIIVPADPFVSKAQSIKRGCCLAYIQPCHTMRHAVRSDAPRADSLRENECMCSLSKSSSS